MPQLLSDFLQKEMPKQAMVIGRGILPKKGKLVIGAPSKTGKSFFVINMALDLALGKPIFNAFYDEGKPVFPVYQQNRVLYIENEIGEASLQNRLRSITGGGDMGGLELYIKSRDMGMRMDTPSGRELITKEISEVRPDVVFIDPLAQFHLSDENSAQEMGAVMRVGDHWMEDFGCSLVYVHHTGHQDPKVPRHGGARLRGSTAIFAAADSVIVLERKSAKNCKEPVIEMSFDLRHDEALEDIYVKKLHSGVIRYIGENLSNPTAVEDGLKPRAARSKYDNI